MKSSRTFTLFVLSLAGLLTCVQIHRLTTDGTPGGCFAASSPCSQAFPLLNARVLGLPVHGWAASYFLLFGLILLAGCNFHGAVFAKAVRVLVRLGLLVAAISLISQLVVLKKLCPYCFFLDAVLVMLAGLGWSLTTCGESPGDAWRLFITAAFALVSSVLFLRPVANTMQRPPTSVLALVNGQEVTEDQLRKEIGVTIQPFEEMKYAAETAWLNGRINHLVIRQAADREGISDDAYLTQHVGPSGSPDQETWNNAKERLAEKLKQRNQIAIFLKKPVPAIVDFDLKKAICVGNPNASVRLVVFSDFACPFCRMMSPDVRQFYQNHPSDVLVAYYQFPLKGHPGAKDAAIAAFCADAQGRFPALHDLLHEQSDLSGDTLRSAARKAGLDLEAFETCFKAPETAKKVEAGIAAGEAVGVDSIPAVFINGKLIGGLLTLDALEEHYREEISAAKK